MGKPWYIISSYRAYQAVSLVVVILISFSFRRIWPIVPTWLYVANIVIGVTAMISDRWTTIRCLRLQERFKRLRIIGGMCEQNDLVGNVRTVRAFLISPAALILDAVCLFFCIAGGGSFGFAVCFTKGWASLNNLHTARLMERTIARRRRKLMKGADRG